MAEILPLRLMKRIDYIIISFMMFTWFLDDLYHLAPRKFWINPFPFSEKEVTAQRYIDDLTIHLNYIIFAICILIRKIKIHWLTKDVIYITIGLIVFSGIWYGLYYGNPFYKIELWLKFITIGAIYISIFSIRWHGKRDNRICNR